MQKQQHKHDAILRAYDAAVSGDGFTAAAALLQEPRLRSMGVNAIMLYRVLNEHRPEWRLIVARKRMEKRV